MGMCFVRLKQHDMASKAFDRAIELDPANASAMVARAVLELNKKTPESVDVGVKLLTKASVVPLPAPLPVLLHTTTLAPLRPPFPSSSTPPHSPILILLPSPCPALYHSLLASLFFACWLREGGSLNTCLVAIIFTKPLFVPLLLPCYSCFDGSRR
jgi:hypothetical protein